MGKTKIKKGVTNIDNALIEMTLYYQEDFPYLSKFIFIDFINLPDCIRAK